MLWVLIRSASSRNKKNNYLDTSLIWNYSETCVRKPRLRLTLKSGWCEKRCLSYKGTCHVILLAKLHGRYLYKTATFPQQPLKPISKVALLHRFHCTCIYLQYIPIWWWLHSTWWDTSELQDYISLANVVYISLANVVLNVTVIPPCALTLSTLGKLFSRKHFEISFPENRIWHFTQIVCTVWNLKSNFLEK